MKNGMESRAQSAGGINQSRFNRQPFVIVLLMFALLLAPFIVRADFPQTRSPYWYINGFDPTPPFPLGGHGSPTAACLAAQAAVGCDGTTVLCGAIFIEAPQDNTSGPDSATCWWDTTAYFKVPGYTRDARDWTGSRYSCPANSKTVLRPSNILTGPDWCQCKPGFNEDGLNSCTPNLVVPDPNNGPHCDPTGNPINTGSGNKYQTEALFGEAGLFPLALQLSYNSTPQIDSSQRWVGRFGVNWIAQWEQRIKVYIPNPGGMPTVVGLRRTDGRERAFRIANTGTAYIPNADVNDKLQALVDSQGKLVGWNGTVGESNILEMFDANGLLLKRTDQSGLVQQLTYADGKSGKYPLDAPNCVLPSGVLPPAGIPLPGVLNCVTDTVGRQLNFQYDSVPRVSKMITSAGEIYLYAYDTNDNLTSVTYPDGKIKTYLYNEPANTSGANLPHALTGITDENGVRFATYQYSADGHAISTGHANGADLHTLAYNVDASGNPVSTTVTDPLGTARTHNFTTILGVVKSTGQSQPGGSGCSAASSAMTYDANGNLASRADFNSNQSCYAYDLARNLETARVEGLASGSACPTSLATYTPVAGTAQRKILTDWHPSFRLPVKVTEAGRETSTVYDTHGNVTSNSIKDTASGKTRTWSTSYTYHATIPGVLVQKVEDGPRIDVSDLTTTDYYAPDASCAGTALLGCRGQVKQITNALGHITHYDTYDANGHVTQITDPNGLVTLLTYSPRGWLTSRKVDIETTKFDYDNVGQLTKLTRPDASYVGFEYDPAHRLTAIVQQDSSRLTYTLDPIGNRITDTITGPTGTVYYSHRRTFDALNRLWQDIGAYNQTITYQYDAKGNMKGIDGARTDVADITTLSYDTLDRLTQTLNADGGIEKITPNALDQTTRVVDPANQATVQTVNALDDITQTVSADTGTTIRTYDEAGNLKTETDARNITVTYGYDALNRLIQKQSSDTATPVYTYVYDSCSKGRLCFVQRNGQFHLYYNYDFQGRRTYQLSAVPGGNWYYSQYFYDAYGRLTTTVYPTGRSVTQSYDSQGRISQIATQPQSGTPITVLARNFVYSYPFAGPQSFSYGNGNGFYQSRNQDYQAEYLFDGQRYKLYNYDPAGNVARLTDINNTAQSYTYDNTGRLTSMIDSATGGFGTLGYSYDKNSNRQSETRNSSVLPYVYSPAGSNWLYQRGIDIRSKTPNGNTASMSGANLSYDGFNRLSGSVTAAETTSYTYNALGERIKKINQNGLSASFHFSPSGQLLFEQDANGSTKAYVWLDGRPLARIDNDASIYYYHVDHLGTPQAMTDSAGAMVWKADYNPFGKASVRVGTIENNLRLPGQYYDRETGLHYNYFRDYDPSTGRYVETDPIGLDGGLNIYSYANQNPLSFTDPAGLQAGAGAFPGASPVPSPAAHPVFQRGTPANDAFVSSTTQILNAVSNAMHNAVDAVKTMCQTNTCPACNPPAGERFNKVTHWVSHSQDPASGSHGCAQSTGSPVHWHYSVNDQNPTTCQCFKREHVFGGCGVAP